MTADDRVRAHALVDGLLGPAYQAVAPGGSPVSASSTSWSTRRRCGTTRPTTGVATS